MRKTLQNFKDHVTPYQLSKGRDYFNKNRVTRLRWKRDEDLWKADVRGREPYEVEIKMDNGTIYNVYCDCVAHANDEYCKHVLAVLLAIEQCPEPVEEIEVIPPPPPPTKEEIGMAALAGADYAGAEHLAVELLSVPITSDKLPEEVNQGFRLLVAISKAAIPQDMQERIYELAYKVATDPQYEIPALRVHALQVLMQLCKGKEEQMLDIINALLKHKSYKRLGVITDQLGEMKLPLLLATGNEKERKKLLMQHSGSVKLRDYFISEADNAGDFAGAKQMAETGMHIFKNQNNYHAHFSRTRDALFKKYDEIGGKRQHLLEDYQRTRNLEYYRLLKATYDAKDWPAVAESKFIAHLEKSIYVNNFESISRMSYSGPSLYTSDELAGILMEEQDFPRLLKLLQHKASFRLTEKYEEQLLPHYPKELLEIYSQILLKYATEYKHADAIQLVYQTLKKIKKWKGGKAVVTNIVADFTKRFSTRLKFLEVIAKV